MTVFAASSIVYVAVSPEHGGCGESHVRPVVQGAPVKVWGLECAKCEDHLRSDPHWAATISNIPETYDEKIGREDWERRGALDRDQVLALALAKLAGVELPETLRRTVSGLAPHIPGTVECDEGHENRAGAKFCAECGSPMREQSPPAAVVTCPEGHENDVPAKFCAECGAGLGGLPSGEPAGKKRLKDMRADDLRALARESGLDETGTRTDVLARLQAKDAGALPVPA